MENLKSSVENDLVGKKVRGFKFESYKHGSPNFFSNMTNYIGQVGVIEKLYGNDRVKVRFSDGDFWWYPANEISKHLVENEKSYPVTRKQLSEIYNSVCDKWKSEIHVIMHKGGRFSESFEVPQSLIWRARVEANTEQLKWIESVFGEMKTELEVGKWYKSWNDTHNGYDLSYYTGTGLDYGFHSSGCLFSEQYWIKNTMSSEWKEATPQEVEKALIEEAKRRYKVGDKLSMITIDFSNGSRIFSDKLHFRDNRLWLSNDCGYSSCIFKDGQWATIIKQDKIEVGDWAYLEESGFKKVKVESQAKALCKKGWSKVTDEQVLKVLNNYKVN